MKTSDDALSCSAILIDELTDAEPHNVKYKQDLVNIYCRTHIISTCTCVNLKRVFVLPF